MNLNLRALPFFIVTFLFLISCQPSSTASDETINHKATTTIEKTDKKQRVLRHVVLFKFKKESTAEEISQLNQAFNALPATIPVIKDFEWGINDSPENFHQDFTHCYLLTFDSEVDRDSIYAPHPAHKAFGESLGPHLDGVFVVDYWTNP